MRFSILLFLALTACGGASTTSGTATTATAAGTPSTPGVHLEAGDKIGGDGTLALPIVADAMTAHLDAVRACYRRELERDAYLHGRVVVEFTVGSNGSVNGLMARADGIGDPAVASCAADMVRDLHLPHPEGGEVRFRFPLVFDP